MCRYMEIANAGLLRYSPRMSDAIDRARQRFERDGYLEDLSGVQRETMEEILAREIERDLVSGKSLAELPAWEVVE